MEGRGRPPPGWSSKQSRSRRAPQDTVLHTYCVLTPKGQVNHGECLHLTLSLEIGTKKKGKKKTHQIFPVLNPNPTTWPFPPCPHPRPWRCHVWSPSSSASGGPGPRAVPPEDPGLFPCPSPCHSSWGHTLAVCRLPESRHTPDEIGQF